MVTPTTPLTSEEIRQGWFETVKKYTNNFHNIATIDDAPLPIRIAVDKMVEFGARDGSVSQEKIADLSLTFRDLEGNLPSDITSLLAPWCSLRF